MSSLDWLVILLYFLGVVSIGWYLGRGQGDMRDYYLANRSVSWWQSGLSTMATQLGAISFVSAPAFVTVAEDGGLKWLCYELGVPLGILVVMVWILPVLHRGRCLSIYTYLERRFDGQASTLVGFLFLLGRALATAVSVLAGGIILSTALDVTTPRAILMVGSVTIVYSVLGGMRTVVKSDVLQMGIVIAGIVICGGAALRLVGWEASWRALEPARREILDFSHFGLSGGEAYSFWPMLLGGIFLYASYYGCDQSQVQRELSVGSLDGGRKSLMLNALARFPIVLLYCTMGVLVGAALLSSTGMAEASAVLGLSPNEVAEALRRDPDRLLPLFVLSFLPHGLVGLIFVAIMAALMSSLDSAINSLSAVTMQNFYKFHLRPLASERHYLLMSKIFALFWGVFCIAAALAFSGMGKGTRETTIVLINAVGSLLYGPILAAFLLGITSQWAQARAVKIAVLTGVGANLVTWLSTDISWLWWNVIGFIITSMTCALFSLGSIVRPSTVVMEVKDGDWNEKWRRYYVLTGIYFAVIVMICWGIQKSLMTYAIG